MMHKRHPQTTTMDDEAASLGPLRDNFSFKKRPDGTFEKTTVVCKLCKKEFAYHRSYSSLKYHLKAKHVAASTAVPSSGTNKRSSQATLDQMTGFRAKITRLMSQHTETRCSDLQTGVKSTTYISMWAKQRRWLLTSGEHRVTTLHSPSTTPL
ncbi:hypothetical protein SRHO_G00279920 [Serrasalmus rhombeus]